MIWGNRLHGNFTFACIFFKLFLVVCFKKRKKEQTVIIFCGVFCARIGVWKKILVSVWTENYKYVVVICVLGLKKTHTKKTPKEQWYFNVKSSVPEFDEQFYFKKWKIRAFFFFLSGHKSKIINMCCCGVFI